MPSGFSSVVQEFLLAQGGGGFVREIHPADEMYRFNFDAFRSNADAAAIMYFEKGRQIADAFEAAIRWRFGESGAATTLDFASGYGRATRFFAGRGATRELWVSEIEAEAVAFQERAFGVRGIVSTFIAREFSPGRTFDAILAASFFSHLPPAAFAEWLAVLAKRLDPGGLLAFSVHGPSLLAEEADWSAGIVFRAQSETNRLDPRAYGTSWVTPEFVAGAVRSACGEDGVLEAVPFGLCGHQDLYLLARPPGLPAPLRAGAIPVFPRGELDTSELRSGVLRVSGWAETAGAGESPPVAFLSARGEVEISPGTRGPARRRWSFDFPVAGVPPDEILRIEARSSAGLRSTIAIGTLRPFL
jgi:SAM-dependent methyltransferase